ncbi:cobalamin B12-binding domain-containing protein [Methylobacterium sp. J-078]|nr:cobalamin B12-binding domain-containing protein [Methylobacterium sp. J-078]
MDDVRQFGDCLHYEISGRDLSELFDMHVGSKQVDVRRKLSLQKDLASIVEAEIIPRLMLAHRAEPVVSECNILPDAEQIAAFADLMLAPGEDGLENGLAELLGGGLALDSLLLDLLAPTARHLGTLWEEDICDFVEVTRAMGRLHRVMRDLTQRFGCEPRDGSEGRSILLLPCPGDSHSFGVAVVERFFVAAGWDVSCPGSRPDGELQVLTRESWFDVVGLSLASEVLLPKVAETIAALRRHSRNPAIRVIVGGAAFAGRPDLFREIGADATAADAREAPALAESLLDLPARPC